MPRIFDPLFKALLGLNEQQLINEIQYLRTENRLLRSKLPKRITITPSERTRLIKFASKLPWRLLKETVSIVSPWTIARWIRESTTPGRKRTRRRRRIGRPPLSRETRKLVIKIAKETGLGYGRLHGELRKLGIVIGKTTIKKILREAGLVPDPNRGEGSWSEFIKIHANTLWACDFFSVKALTPKGFKEYYAILFIHIGSRRIHITPVTQHPDRGWVTQQARNFRMNLEDPGEEVSYLIHDRDTKFTRSFQDIFRSEGTNVHMLPIRSPDMNAYAERAIQSVKQECLDHFIKLGERHTNHLIQEYVEHYNTERPHSRRGHLPPIRASNSSRVNQDHTGRIICRSRLGGLLKSYSGAA